jgi:hypothetical protein
MLKMLTINERFDPKTKNSSKTQSAPASTVIVTSVSVSTSAAPTCDKANEGPRKSDGAVGDTAYSQCQHA